MKVTVGKVGDVRSGMEGMEGKYLSFSLKGEEYAIGILKVKEIIGLMPITPVPQSPEFIKGVINLRGKVIPVVDLRMRFAMSGNDYTERTCIIVVEVDAGSKIILIGIIVDSVSEVLNIKEADLETAPSFGTSLKSDYIQSMAKIGGGVKILLDINKVLDLEEKIILDQVA